MSSVYCEKHNYLFNYDQLEWHALRKLVEELGCSFRIR